MENTFLKWVDENYPQKKSRILLFLKKLKPKETFCDVCDEPVKLIKPDQYAVSVCCERHRKYENILNTILLRKRLRTKPLSETMAEKLITEENCEEKDLVMMRQAYKQMQQYREFLKLNYCGICEKKLSETEKKRADIYDFHITCDEHRQYVQHFQVGIIRKQAGIDEKKLKNIFNIYERP